MQSQNRTKRHHYVPNFYLKHFIDQDGKIWIYDKRAKDIFASLRSDLTENVAVQSNIYSVVKDDGSYDDRIDEWLQTVEAAAAPVHLKLMNGTMVDGQERADYAVFLSSLLTRTPAMLNTVAELSGVFMQRSTNRILEDQTAFEKEIEAFKESRFCGDPDKVDIIALGEFLRDKNRYTLRIHQQAGLDAFRSTDKLTDKLFSMTWSLYESKHRQLITSDNPVVHTFVGCGPTREQSTNSREIVTLPLSPRMLLELGWQRRPNGMVRQLERKTASLFNSMRAHNAEQYVFSNGHDAGIASLVKKHRNSRMRADLTIAGPTEAMAPMTIVRKMRD